MRGFSDPAFVSELSKYPQLTYNSFPSLFGDKFYVAQAV